VKFWKDKKFQVRAAFVIFMYFVVILLNYLASQYIKNTFVHPAIVKDLLWNNLPDLPILWISEVVIAITIIWMFVYAFKNDKFYFPYIFYLWGIFQIIRAGLIVLTPLGFPNHYSGIVPVGDESVFAYGAFPSGHLAYPTLAYLLTKHWAFILLSLIGGLALLISRGHYSIDLVGTLLLGYFVYHVSEKYVKWWFIDEKA